MMFEFQFAKKDSTHLFGLSIWEHMLTFYERHSEYRGDMQLPNLAVGILLRALSCLDTRSCQVVKENDCAHVLGRSHDEASHVLMQREAGHGHIAFHQPVTPDMLNETLHELAAAQANKTGLAEAFKRHEILHFFCDVTAGRRLKRDTETDLFAAEEMPAVLSAYQQYYAEHQADMDKAWPWVNGKIQACEALKWQQAKDARQLFSDATWASLLFVLGPFATNFALFASMAVVYQSVQAVGLSVRHAAKVSAIIGLVGLAAASATPAPLMIMLSVFLLPNVNRLTTLQAASLCGMAAGIGALQLERAFAFEGTMPALMLSTASGLIGGLFGGIVSGSAMGVYKRAASHARTASQEING